MTKNLTILVVAAATFIILYGAQQVWRHYEVDETPEVCLIAGEGVTLKSGRTMILMDGLYREGFPEDKLPSDELMSAIETAQSPYDGVDLVTVSHRHIDHFGIPSILKFMNNNPDAALVLPPEAAAELYEAGGGAFRERVQAVYPERGKPETFEAGGITLKVYNLDHGTEVENIGILVELDGRSFFHMGDFAAGDFAANGIKGLKVDYLLVPYWYLRNEANFKVLSDNIEARYLVPIHMPGPDLPEDFAQRVGSFEDLFEGIRQRADNVLMLYEEGACFRPENQE